jgi:hypothetical protein
MSLLRLPMIEYRVTQRGKTCDVCQELDRLEKFGLIEKIVPRETKPVKQKNPDIKVAIDYYYTQFLDKFGVKPDIKGVKDASILSRVIKNYGLDRTKQMIDTFLNSDDSFISSSGWTLGVFSFVINKLLLNCKPVTKTGKALKTIADWGNNVDEKSVSDRDSDVIDLQP